jgi:hypothetical protein
MARERRLARIDARQRWVRTGIVLQAGRTYRLTAQGEWRDKDKRCGPDGYPSCEYPKRLTAWLLGMMEWTRRVPDANWLALIGALDSHRSMKFVIGSGTAISPQRDGELLCFANDCVLTYGNNSGSVDLEVS